MSQPETARVARGPDLGRPGGLGLSVGPGPAAAFAGCDSDSVQIVTSHESRSP